MSVKALDEAIQFLPSPQMCELQSERRIHEMMVLSFTLQSHSSSAEIQLGDSPEKGKRREYVSLYVCLVTTHDLVHPSNGPAELSHSINKDQQSLFTLPSSIAYFLFTSPPSPWIITPRLSTLWSLVPIQAQKLSSTNLNEFTIIASPVVTEVWLHLCLTFQTSSWLDPQWKRGFGDYLIVTQIESPSPSCAAMVVKRHIPLLFEWALRL